MVTVCSNLKASFVLNVFTLEWSVTLNNYAPVGSNLSASR